MERDSKEHKVITHHVHLKKKKKIGWQPVRQLVYKVYYTRKSNFACGESNPHETINCQNIMSRTAEIFKQKRTKEEIRIKRKTTKVD